MHLYHRRGISLTGYGLIVGLIAVVGIAAVQSIGDNVDATFTTVDDELTGVVGAGTAGASSEGSASPEASVSPSPIYSFSSHQFTPCGQQGRSGPSVSACRSVYDTSADGNWDEDGANFDVSGGIQLWTVPVTGNYLIQARGAQGASTNGGTGGLGAVMGGQFALTAGDQLKILPGQVGSRTCTSTSNAGGGGGGSFVTLSDNTPLIIAGGGGGASHSHNGGAGEVTNNGGAPFGGSPSVPLSGGSNGSGGQASDGNSNNAGSGAGLLGNGAIPSGSHRLDSISFAFVNGALGGSYDGTNSGSPPAHAGDGGFGGGGAADDCSVSGGGGGGYSGGAGGRHVSDPDASVREGGGGGGSYNDGSSPTSNPGSNSGDGSITITLL
ncbi:MAG: hypothetical protein Alpg2KO_18990 [Alphaproteobacteria bacterium]